MDIKESHLIDTAEYAIVQGIDGETAFNWWVPHVIKKRAHIISIVKNRSARYLKKTHKFGVKLSNSEKHALNIDKKNGNTHWSDEIAKATKNVRVAFKILNEDKPVPIGYTFICCHMIFDVNMEDFRRKARLVAGGHMTETTATMTYVGVVSCESVRLTLMLSTLNALEVKFGNDKNVYITAPITEKYWSILGPEFEADEGRKAIIVRALYGVKSAGADFRSHLCICMRGLGYEPCLDDPDLWHKSEGRTDDGHEYYSYIICYVDDILVIHHDSLTILKIIDSYFNLKPNCKGDPDMYLGAKGKIMTLEHGTWCWYLSPSKYVQ